MLDLWILCSLLHSRWYISLIGFTSLFHTQDCGGYAQVFWHLLAVRRSWFISCSILCWCHFCFSVCSHTTSSMYYCSCVCWGEAVAGATEKPQQRQMQLAAAGRADRRQTCSATGHDTVVAWVTPGIHLSLLEFQISISVFLLLYFSCISPLNVTVKTTIYQFFG